MRCFTRCVGISAIVLAVVASAERTRAEITHLESIEWLTDVVESIGIYRVESISVVEERPGWQKNRIEVLLVESMKGDAPKRQSFATHVSKKEAEKGTRPHVTTASEYLLFLLPSAKSERERIRYRIQLDHPTTHAYTKKFDILETREAILAAIRTRLEYNRSSDRDMPPVGQVPRKIHGLGYVNLKPPTESKLYWTNGVRITVPADPDIKEYLVGWLRSEHVRERASAARRLAAFPGDDTVRILEPLLEDPGVTVWRVQDRETREWKELPIHSVRHAAYLALRELGVDVEPPSGLPEDPLMFDSFW